MGLSLVLLKSVKIRKKRKREIDVNMVHSVLSNQPATKINSVVLSVVYSTVLSSTTVVGSIVVVVVVVVGGGGGGIGTEILPFNTFHFSNFC